MTDAAPSSLGLWLAPPRVGIVSSRHRLCAALQRPLDEASAWLSEQVEAAAVSGVEFFQVREADLGGAALLTLVRALTAVSRGRVRVVVNDRADVAAAAGAGLHLRVASMPVDRLRPWLPPATWISCAAHDEAEVSGAGEVNAVLAGTVHDTASKSTGTRTLGMAGLARVVAASARPVFAIGGMAATDWPAIAAAGAVGIAAIGWVLPRAGEGAGDGVVRAMEELRAVIDGREPDS